MSSCTGLRYFKTLVRLRLLLVVSYEVCVHAKKKEKKNGNWNIITRNGHDTIHTSKSGILIIQQLII